MLADISSGKIDPCHKIHVSTPFPKTQHYWTKQSGRVSPNTVQLPSCLQWDDEDQDYRQKQKFLQQDELSLGFVSLPPPTNKAHTKLCGRVAPKQVQKVSDLSLYPRTSSFLSDALWHIWPPPAGRKSPQLPQITSQESLQMLPDWSSAFI